MESLKGTARRAGLLYVLVALMTPFVLLYVPGRLDVPGDASATVARIAANQGLYIAALTVGLFSQVLFVMVVLALYRLLRGVDAQRAGLMAAFILVQVPLALVGLSHDVATLQLIRGGPFLDGFDPPQRDALALLMIHVDRQGVLVAQVFWGLWLLPLGGLVVRSGFLPRLLGVWLVLNGLAYLALSGIGLVAPEYRATAFTWAMPFLLGELALGVWLLVIGIRPKSPRGAGPGSPAI